MINIVPLSNSADDYGLYITGHVNDFGTPLHTRGTLDEVLSARAELTATRRPAEVQ